MNFLLQESDKDEICILDSKFELFWSLPNKGENL